MILIMILSCIAAIANSMRPMAATPYTCFVLSHSCDVCETCIFRLILVSIICITGANLHNSILIIRFAIICCYRFITIVLSGHRFQPDVIIPIIVAIRETNKYIVTVRIICLSQYVFIQNRDDTFYSTGTAACRIGFQSRSDHHNIADRIAIVSSGNFVICRPDITDILPIISCNSEIMICVICIVESMCFSACFVSVCYRRMISAGIMPGNYIVQIPSVARTIRVSISIIATARISIQIKFEIIHNPVIMQIQNRITFRCNRNLLCLVSLLQAESFVMTCGVCIVCDNKTHTGCVVFSTIIHCFIRYRCTNCTFLDHRTRNVITSPVHILCPEYYRIFSCSICLPFRIDCCFFS